MLEFRQQFERPVETPQPPKDETEMEVKKDTQIENPTDPRDLVEVERGGKTYKIMRRYAEELRKQTSQLVADEGLREVLREEGLQGTFYEAISSQEAYDNAMRYIDSLLADSLPDTSIPERLQGTFTKRFPEITQLLLTDEKAKDELAAFIGWHKKHRLTGREAEKLELRTWLGIYTEVSSLEGMRAAVRQAVEKARQSDGVVTFNFRTSLGSFLSELFTDYGPYSQYHKSNHEARKALLGVDSRGVGWGSEAGFPDNEVEYRAQWNVEKAAE